MDDLSQLEAALGHRFKQRELLIRALTHSSLTHERGDEPVCHNEQMEFLGDAILGFVVSRELVRRFPDSSEGQLSKMKAHLVSSAYLHEAAGRIGLGRYLQLGRSEEKSGGRQKRTLLADAMEAVIAAVYLDAGLRQAGAVVKRLVLREALRRGAREFAYEDYKSALQEQVQSEGRGQPVYRVVGESGPEHRKMFTVEVSAGGQLFARAEGHTKKRAEQEAARALLSLLREMSSESAAALAPSSADELLPGEDTRQGLTDGKS